MRLLRIGPVDHETPAVLVAGRDDLAHDLFSLTDDIDGALLSSDSSGQIDAAIASGDSRPSNLTGDASAHRPPRPHAIYAMGLNCVAHTEEARADTAVELPAEPLGFTKAQGRRSGR